LGDDEDEDEDEDKDEPGRLVDSGCPEYQGGSPETGYERFSGTHFESNT
jgi:hypothetical protein